MEDPGILPKEVWIEKLRQAWRSPEDMRENLYQALVEYFKGSSDPLNSSPESSQKPYTLFIELCFAISQEHSFFAELTRAFELWHSKQETKHSCDINTCKRALELIPKIRRQDLYIVERLCVILDLKCYAQEAKAVIDTKIEKNESVAAAKMIIGLKLQDHYDFNIVAKLAVDPINSSLIEAYIGDSIDRKLKHVGLFDHWASLRPHKLKELLISIGVDHKKVDKWSQKSLGKMTCNLVKKYELDEEVACPLLMDYRERGFLRHQTREFIVGKAVDEQTWADNVDSVVRRRPKVAMEIVNILSDFKDFHRAAKWAKKLDVPQKYLRLEVVKHLKKLPEGPVVFGDSEAEKENDQILFGYLQFPLPLSSIIFVDNLEAYKAFLADLKAAEMPLRAGVDAEWPPQQTQLGTAKIALLQIALDTKVFLIDILTLTSVLTDDQWVEGLGRQFIANPDIRKLGFGLKDDFKILFACIPCLDKAGVTAKNIVDLGKVVSGLIKKAPGLFINEISPVVSSPDLTTPVPNLPSSPSILSPDVSLNGSDLSYCSSPTKERSPSVLSPSSRPPSIPSGLSGLVMTLLGKPLDKRPQCSDWNRRPLRENQLVYAALDAFCLLLLDDRVEELSSGLQEKEDENVDAPTEVKSNSNDYKFMDDDREKLEVKRRRKERYALRQAEKKTKETEK